MIADDLYSSAAERRQNYQMAQIFARENDGTPSGMLSEAFGIIYQHGIDDRDANYPFDSGYDLNEDGSEPDTTD